MVVQYITIYSRNLKEGRHLLHNMCISFVLVILFEYTMENHL